MTGGADSPLWVALLLVSTATPLLLRGRWAAGLLLLVWLADGLFLLAIPPAELIPALLTWALRAAGVGLIALVLYRALSIEEGLRTRSQRRERVLHDFLELSNRLRVTSEPQTVLEEVALAVQASGKFDCVTLSRVDWRAGTATVAAAIGASGRRLKAIEGLQFAWDEIAPRLNERRRAGPNTFRAEMLPFRTIKNELHFILPLNSQFAEIQGLLTVSGAKSRQDALEEALPLLELLANQAAAVLDNNALYGTMEQRVTEATASLERSRADLALARDRAETLYRIVRTLAVSLDEREVLTHALLLVAQATDAHARRDHAGRAEHRPAGLPHHAGSRAARALDRLGRRGHHWAGSRAGAGRLGAGQPQGGDHRRHRAGHALAGTPQIPTRATDRCWPRR